MSMVLTTRSPLQTIGMNGTGAKRRSARLSHEDSPPNKKNKTTNGANATATATTVSTKQQDGGSKTVGSKRRKVYDEEVEGFAFTKGKRKKTTKEPAREEPAQVTERAKSPAQTTVDPTATNDAPQGVPTDEIAPKTTTKKVRRKLPTTPERDVSEKTTRRSNRTSNEKSDPVVQISPQRTAHVRPPNLERSPSPEAARPVTVEKKRKQGADGVEEEKVMRIMLPFADTPIIRKNREMRKGSDGSRRSSSGMRGRRASSLIDEGRGHDASNSLSDSSAHSSPSYPQSLETCRALPHAEVSTSDFFKHISVSLTEPRRMRCLLGWCGIRSLPAGPPPSDDVSTLDIDGQARHAAQRIVEDLSSDFVTKGTLSDWFSRDESTPIPQMPAKKRPNPRNIANTAKLEELTRELERLQMETAEWDEITKSASVDTPFLESEPASIALSPLKSDLLDSPQRAIYDQLNSQSSDESVNPTRIQQRLREISDDLEFAVDQFAHGVHALQVTKETAERLADRSLADAASALEERHKQRTTGGKSVDPMDALRGLAKVLNSKYR